MVQMCIRDRDNLLAIRQTRKDMTSRQQKDRAVELMDRFGITKQMCIRDSFLHRNARIRLQALEVFGTGVRPESFLQLAHGHDGHLHAAAHRGTASGNAEGPKASPRFRRPGSKPHAAERKRASFMPSQRQ